MATNIDRDPYDTLICFLSGIGISLAVAGAGLGIAAESRSTRTKNAIYNFISQNFPNATVKINTTDLKVAGALAVVACFLLFVWFLYVAIAFFNMRSTTLQHKRSTSIGIAVVSLFLTAWLLGSVIAATVLYATKGPMIEGSINGDSLGSDTLRAILGQLQSLGFTLALEYKNIPRTLVRQAIVVQWLAWFFCFLATLFIIAAAADYKKRPNIIEPDTERRHNPVEEVQDDTIGRSAIEEKRRDEGPSAIDTLNTGDPNAVVEKTAGENTA